MKERVGPVHRCVCLAALLWACVGLCSGDDLGEPRPTMDQILVSINQARQEGRIDNETALVNRVLAFFAPDMLPQEFAATSPLPTKCATPVVLEVRWAWEQLSPKAKDRISQYFQRPSTQHTFGSPDAHFRIHYDTSGPNAVYQPTRDSDPRDGVPDYVNRCAEIFDYCWAMTIDSLGYDAPPSDGVNGGDDRYDIYLQRSEGAYGVTFPESASSQYPGRNDWSSYIYVDPTYDGFGYTDRLDPLSVTAAHEFFHAVQFVYDIREGSWIMEASSVWMEDLLFDDVNDYRQYLGTFFSAPELSLDTSEPDGHPYSICVWTIYLSEKFGIDIIRLIWEEIITLPAMGSLGRVLELSGSSLEESFREFTVWNYLTRSRATGFHLQYEEAASFPDVAIARTYSLYPVIEKTVAHDNLPFHLASNYVRFKSNSASGDLKILFNGDAGYQWKVSIVVDSAGSFTSLQMPVDNAQGFIRILDWQSKEEAVLIPCVTSTAGGSAAYSFSALVVPSGRPSFRVQEIQVDDAFAGNADGYIDPGERVDMALTLLNSGISASGVTAQLSAPDPDVVVEKATAAFGNMDENGAAENSADPFTISVRSTAQLHRAECLLTLFSNNGIDTSQVIFALTVGHPHILLVDDDYSEVHEAETYDVEEYYRSSLDSIEAIYDYWSVRNQTSPDSTFLKSFRTVVWFTGYATPSLTADDQRQLAAFLDAGGRLFISGQDIARELSSTSFLREYLHAGYVSNRSDQGIVYGVSDDPISDEFFFFSTIGSDGANNQVSPDVITALDGAQVVLTYAPPSYQTAGIRYEGQTCRIVFFSFGFEGIVRIGGDSQALRASLLDNVLSWLNFEPRRADVTADGQIDIRDVIRTAQIILAIAPSPDEYQLWASDCDGNGTVNVLDVLGIVNVILGVGGCGQ